MREQDCRDEPRGSLSAQRRRRRPAGSFELFQKAIPRAQNTDPELNPPDKQLPTPLLRLLEDAMYNRTVATLNRPTALLQRPGCAFLGT